MIDLESIDLIIDPLSSTAGLDVQDGSWSTSGGVVTLLGVGGGLRNPDGVGDATHNALTWGVTVDARVDVKVDPSVVSNDTAISAGIGFGPSTKPQNSNETNPAIDFLGLPAGVTLCAQQPSSSPTSFSLMNVLWMRESPSASLSTFKTGLSVSAGWHEIRLLLSFGYYHVWLDGLYLGNSRAQWPGDTSRVHLWGQSNHASTPHVFWRNLRVKTFPLGISPPEEP